MSAQKATRQDASQRTTGERCLCREVLDQFRENFGISENVQEHFTNSRIEFLKGIRAVIDNRIESLGKTGQRGTKIAVE
jgi:hypothetical protein